MKLFQFLTATVDRKFSLNHGVSFAAPPVLLRALYAWGEVVQPEGARQRERERELASSSTCPLSSVSIVIPQGVKLGFSLQVDSVQDTISFA